MLSDILRYNRLKSLSLRQQTRTTNRLSLSCFLISFSCPKLFFACWLHLTLTFDLWSNVLTLGRVDASITLLSLARTFRTGVHVPFPDIVAAALQAQTACLIPVRWGNIGNDATHDNILDGLAVRTIHGCYLLAEQPTPLIHFGFISASLAAIFQFPGHQSTGLTFLSVQS